MHDFLNDDLKKEKIIGIWHNGDDIPEKARIAVAAGIGNNTVYDVVTPIEKGKEWLFELTCKYQPRTGAMIMEGGPLLFREENYFGKLKGALVVEVNGKVVRIYRDFLGYNPSDDDYETYGETTGYEMSLPDGLGQAYYTRFTGMSLLPGPVASINSHALPKDKSNWNSTRYYMDDYEDIKDKQLNWFYERFPQYSLYNEHGDRLDYKFSCWLDTNLGYRDLFRDLTPQEEYFRVSKPPADALFVRQDINNSPIYHVVDGKLDEMRVLNNPAEAVDLYCEHVLLGREERFDFIEHGRPLD
ncbi:hypothetical protein LPB140_00575 [Sphingorhabdus lutea]|uniref:Uncharacterized protein n=2 Tax=Sphingorhabdus lutea TaxID=1913578 RepID=A0A1L3J8Z1_9SPHN|nr:hypothetical protein LPB140_00575 [Sphingorhabdus lutea]